MPTTQRITAAGPSDPVVIRPQNVAGFNPSITAHCIVAPNSTLTYNVEVSPDDNEPRNWVPIDASWTNLTASMVKSSGIKARAVRVNVTSLTSGSLAFNALQ